MTVTAADILTAATIPKYLEGRWDVLSKVLNVDLEAPSVMEGIQVDAIEGGNVNYAFRITFPNLDGNGSGSGDNNRTIFLKQVRDME